MEEQFQLLFDKMLIEMKKQTTELKDTITNSIIKKMDEKLQPIIAENKDLKFKMASLEKEIEYLKRERKQNNIIIFRKKEGEKSTADLLKEVRATFKNDLDINIEEYEVNKIYRIGKEKNDDKPRPILLSFVNEWKKDEVMRNKKNLKEVYITEDYTKEVMEKRKELQSKLIEERKKGNFAYLKYDKLIVKENKTNNEAKKRGMSKSPENNTHQHKQQTLMPERTNRLNAFDMMRSRSHSLSSTASGSKQ